MEKPEVRSTMENLWRTGLPEDIGDGWSDDLVLLVERKTEGGKSSVEYICVGNYCYEDDKYYELSHNTDAEIYLTGLTGTQTILPVVDTVKAWIYRNDLGYPN